ncbi:MAG: PQQ-binding-like beta-propeller repeat protein [Gemmataceae bacterium]
MRKVLTLVVAACGLAALRAGEWPQFRGPTATGVAADATLPIEWGPDKNVAWKVEIPGAGWSSPIVWGDKVFVTTAVTEKQTKPKAGYGPGGGGGGKGGGFPKGPPGDGKDGKDGKGGFPKGGFPKGGFGKGGSPKPPDAVYRWELMCLDRANGKVLWKQLAAEKKPTIPTHSSNTFASETPVTDGERIYAYFGMTGLYCYDLAGKPLWHKDLGTYPMQNGWGTGSSPVLDGDRLFVQCDNEDKSFLVALDKKTGDELWRKPREEKSNWSTPFVWRTKARTEIVALGQTKVRSYDPATGAILWEMGGLDAGSQSSPAATAEMIYFGVSGPMSSNPLYAVKAGASGDITLKEGETSNAGVAWVKTRAGLSNSSPLVYDGYVYTANQGLLNCYDAATGKPAYTKERLPQGRGFVASPFAAGGKLYFLDDNGRTFVVKAGPKFELLGSSALDEMCWASPAVADGALFVRGVDHLFCVK